MRITRAAKVAAFPLIVLALVVALIACQGPTGLDGKDGTPGGTGDTGDTGAQGPQGDVGPGALAAARGTEPLLITKAGKAATDDDPAVPAVPETVTAAVADYFTGGNPADRTYKLKSDALDPLIGGVTATMEAGTLTLSVDSDWMGPNGATADSMLTLTATDTDDQYAEATVYIRSNATPTRSTETVSVTVGTQDAPVDNEDKMYGADPVSCTMLNLCTVDLSGLFVDVNMDESFTYELDEIAEADVGKVTAMIDGSELHITGLKSAAQFTLMLGAKDKAEVAAAEKTSIQITVDGAPSVGPIANQAMTVDDDDRHVGTATDPGTDTIMVDFESSDDAVATASVGTGDDAGKIMVSSHNTGTATITVTVTEEGTDQPDQTATDEFTVTVTS